MPSADIIAIIPASGKGARFGMPKVNASFRGRSFCDHIISCLSDAGINDYRVANYPEATDMLHSIQIAIKELCPPLPNAFLIYPVDHPLVLASTITKLYSAHRRYPSAIIKPLFKNRSGHPIIVPGDMDFDASVEGGLRALIRACGKMIVYVETDDMGILQNINSPKDLPATLSIVHALDPDS